MRNQSSKTRRKRRSKGWTNQQVALAMFLLCCFVLAYGTGCRQLDRLLGNSGAPCTDDASCAQGLSCLTDGEGFPNGYCTRQSCTDGVCPGQFAECIFLDRTNNVTACVEACTADTDCRLSEGYICADLDGSRGCLPQSQAATSAGQIGASCSTDSDCSNNFTCMTNFVFGYCSRPCGSDNDCGDGALCIDQGGGTLRCMDGCDNNQQCRFAYSCTNTPSGGVCDQDDTSSPVRNPGGSADGDACTADINCEGGACITGEDFPGGYCSTRDCDVVGCANTDSTCVALDRQALCFKNCDGPNDCREGYRCTALENEGSVCYALSAVTAPEVDAGGPIAAQCDTTSIGTNSRRATFALGSNVEGFSVVPFSSSGSEIIPTSLTLPDGQTLNFDSEYGFQTINALLLPTIVPMLFPGAPQFDYLVQEGTYQFDFETTDDNACYFVVEQPTLGTTLDVNFYFVGVPGVTAANAGTNRDMADLESEVNAIFANANISIGTVRYFDIEGADRDRYSVIRDFNDIYRLISLSQTPGETREEALSVNVFLIDEFLIPGFNGLLGLSAGIPGVPGVHGNSAAGLAFTTVDLASSPESLAQTMAHEIGHFLGLRHTSERGGSEYDPLQDTPECNAPEDGFACPDAGNLMFPFQLDGDQRAVTNDQIYVLRRNPLVQ